MNVFILEIENGNLTEIEVFSSLELAQSAPRLDAFRSQDGRGWESNPDGWYWPTWRLDNGATATISQHEVDAYR